MPLSELVALNLDVNQYNIDYLTRLMWAARHGHTNVVKQLINDQDKDGCPALMMATRYSYAEIVKELLLLSVNANLKNRNNKTAMDLANDIGDVHVIQILTEYCKGNQAVFDVPVGMEIFTL